MQSDTITIFLILAAAAFACAAVWLWAHKDSSKSKSTPAKEEATINENHIRQRENPMEPKTTGSRVGACLSLIALVIVAQLACGIIYELLFLLFGLLSRLPEFLIWVLAFAFYPVVLFAIYFPVSQFLPWAAECAERICPTRIGLRYICCYFFEIVCFVINLISWVFLKEPFKIEGLFPLLYAFTFRCILKSLP